MLKVLWFINEVKQKKLCDYGSPDQLFTFQILHTVLHFTLQRVERISVFSPINDHGAYLIHLSFKRDIYWTGAFILKNVNKIILC